MRIRRLELMGFKSFPVTTGIDFPEGITAIVGPNGCGKSNILDALMWVMGATSPKLLRSRSMEDVIFAGSQTQPPLGRAEVRLVIDNSHHLACEPYRDLTEIEIKRVVYRSGDSEFWLNKHRCRLRDITEFFLGTGLGTNSYAIIEQGRVSQIISARPEERRLLIDESAGISKYKERKEISLRKMEATRQNLSRVEDVLHEVKRQMNRLKRQAARTRRYQRFKERLDKLLIAKAAFELVEMRARHADLIREHQSVSARVNAKEAEITALEARINEEQTWLLQKEESLREMNVDYAGHQDAMQRKRRELSDLHEKQGRLEEILKALDEKLERSTSHYGQIKTQVSETGESIRLLKKDLEEKTKLIAEKIASYAAESDRLRGLEQQFEEGKQALYETLTLEVEAKNRIVQLNERLQEARRGSVSRAEALQVAEGRLRDLETSEKEHHAALEAFTRRMASVQKEKESIEAALSSMRKEETAHETELREFERKLTEDRSNYQSLLDIKKGMEDVSSKGAKAVLSRFVSHRKDSATCRLVADTVDAPSRYDRALEAVLKDALEFVFVDTHETALEGLAFLKETKSGRSGLIPRERLASCEGVKNSFKDDNVVSLASCISEKAGEREALRCLLRDVWVVENYQDARRIHQRNGFKGVLVTLEGDVFYPNGVIVGGSSNSAAGGRIARNRQIGVLKKQVEAGEKKVAGLREKHARVLAEIATLQTALEKAARELRETEMGAVASERDLKALEKEKNRLVEQIEILQAETEELQHAMRKWGGDEEKTRVSHSRYREEQERLKEENEQLAGKIRLLKEKVDAGNQEVGQLKIDEAKTRQRFQGLETRVRELTRMFHDLEEEIARDRRKQEESCVALTQMGEAETALLEETVRFEEVMAVLKKRIETLELELRQKRDGARALEALRQQHVKEYQQLKEEMSAKVLAMKQVELEKGNITRQVRTHFGRSLEEEDLKVLTEVAVDEEELSGLQEKVQGFGEINFVAVQEFETLKERVTFLEKQREDLLVSLQTLTETIQRINRTTTARFRETFTQVQQNFLDLFVRLFGGGKGELRLTEPENIKESGIEIFAQPPGKRLQAIRQLSGGEKALVAIAFLFALFLVRPSPFCVLDEVDAPLDDRNIDRFNELVISLSGASQFILITHNKRTMSEAHTLLGVTMEQPGISKIVSVALEDVAK